MTLGDGIRRNIASVEPSERALLRDALIELNHRYFAGSRTDLIPGAVSWWFKQDEIHQATHVHGGPEFLPWHREVVNGLEAMLRAINPQLSLHYWDWTQDPRAILGANLGGGTTGTLNLFTPDFMGYGGSTRAPIGDPWAGHGFYVPGAANYRSSDPFDSVNNNPADPPREVVRSVNGSPVAAMDDTTSLGHTDYQDMADALERSHDSMHGFVNMGQQHTAFRDPFVFLLHSNVDRLFARWQTDPARRERLDPVLVYGSASASAALNGNIQPWSGGASTRPWSPPESLGVARTYKHPSIVFPPCYDTNHTAVPIVSVLNVGTPPAIDFTSVPSGETAVRAATFRVYGCSDVTLRVKASAGPAAPFSVLHPASGSLLVRPGPRLYADARIWLAYTAGAAGVAVPDGAVTFECPENGDEFAFVLKASSVARPTVAIMLALDQSWSMSWDAGTSGTARVEVLRDAASTFVELVQQGNGIGLIRFDHDSYPVNDPTFPGLPVTKMASNSVFDPGRVAALGAVGAHTPNPAGNTSVGDGVERARQVLSALPASDYDERAMVVLTDGVENRPLWISDVAGSIDNRTFAIGLGNEHQVNTTALRALARGTGGFLYLTGLLSASIDDYFRLTKVFLQILAGVTNTQVIVDPRGYLAPGSKVRVPIEVNEADIDCTVLVVTDENVVDLSVETPDGTVVDSGMAGGLGMTYEAGQRTRHFRFTLPVAVSAGQHAGTWYALLEIDRRAYKKVLSKMRDRQDRHAVEFATHGARYSLVVQTWSNLRMAAQVEQSSNQPGATLSFTAVVTEYELPVEHRAGVDVEVTLPGGGLVLLTMTETGPGQFQASTSAQVGGIYHARVLARGVTLRGARFTREQLLDAAVWAGGDVPYTPPQDDVSPTWCEVLMCLLGEKVLSPELVKRWREQGIDVEALRDCLGRYCQHRRREIEPR